jgi:hypothetical protein
VANFLPTFFGKDMQKTAIEFNLAMVKVKHSIKHQEKDATKITELFG